jgi:hypothetical protein
MNNNFFLLIILAFILGCMASGMMKQMCSGRLIEGVDFKGDVTAVIDPKQLSVAHLDTSFDTHSCPNGKRIKIEYHNRPLKDIIATLEEESGFCLHRHNIIPVDVQLPGKVGLVLNTILAEFVDPDTQAHVICDENKSIHDCQPASDDVNNNVTLLTNCGWIANTFTDVCRLKEGDSCNPLWDLCENGGFGWRGLNCLDGKCAPCGPDQYYPDGEGGEKTNLCTF